MLPAPTTTQISTPRACTCAIWRAIAWIRSGSAPYSWLPSSASPDSLMRTRWNAGTAPAGCPAGADAATAGSGSVANGEPREAADHDVLARLGGERGTDLLDRAAFVLLAVDVRLLEQHDLLEPGVDLALDDVRADVVRLVGELLLGDARLALDLFARNAIHVDRDRRRGGDVQREVPREADEVLVASDEVRLAVDLDEHADLAVGVDVGLDGALGGRALAALLGLRGALHPQRLDRLLDVAVRLDEGLLALHHPCAGALAQGLHVLGGHAHAVGSPPEPESSVFVVCSAGAAGASSAGGCGADAAATGSLGAGASSAGAAGCSALAGSAGGWGADAPAGGVGTGSAGAAG